ncbi:protein-L-isoaspartate O-methyltransferase [Acidisphaera sp. L21]|uniref:protein-L-isoaspartate O-methyltransferase family protein n=1 Tax=Acidisphaera sp. L21 TaxID=1641851 RepID=UPI00131D2D0F|nr:protein-L-isoaspartate O-methyltransferase [Acidisphaera sp. L21]
MDQLQTDFTAARNNMVDCQVRPNRVTDPRVLDAMRSLPREQFAPPSLAEMAYVDEDLPLGRGRVLIEPLVIARLVQLARLRAGDKVLIVGAGTGYGAAVAAACEAHVTALEEDDALMAIALTTLPRIAPAVRLVQGRLAAGLPNDGPWDAIIIEGAVTKVPDVYAMQLSPGGRLVGVLAATGSSGGRIVLGEPVPGATTLRFREMYDCTTPMLPSLRPAPAFVF